jgi:hypothetical protein
MRRNLSLRGCLKHLPMIFALFSLSLAHAKPRPPVPPLPEGEIARWRFDTTNQPTPFIAQNVHLTESWSGMALEVAGKERALFALPMVRFDGTALNLSPATGTLRFWFAPAWTSTEAKGSGPGAAAALMEIGTWSAGTAHSGCSLGFDAEVTC